MAEFTTLEQLMALPTAQETTAVVSVEGLGTFEVRALSLADRNVMRRECMQGDQWDDDRWEAMLLQKTLMQPALTYDQANKLRERPAFLVSKLIEAVNNLSGMDVRGRVSKEAADAAEARFREGSPTLPGVPAGPDAA